MLISHTLRRTYQQLLHLCVTKCNKRNIHNSTLGKVAVLIVGVTAEVFVPVVSGLGLPGCLFEISVLS